MNAQFVSVPGGVTAPQGFWACGLHAGIRKNKSKKDVALIYCEVPCAAAAVYTRNLVKGAPLSVTKEHLKNGTVRAVICNSGNANTCNADGEEKARAMARIAAEALGIAPKDVAVASTGVIGQTLPLEPFYAVKDRLKPALRRDGGHDAAEAIMTTDTRPKEIALRFECDGMTYTVGGMAKGSGMIHPNMATMLAFLTTDVTISPAALQKVLNAAVDDSFNMVSVDGDTSTNDMALILASGLTGGPEMTEDSPAYALFAEAVREVCLHLAREIAADGEGATKLLECTVSGAADRQSARAAAKSVIRSPLVKSAMFGADANWGRVLCAVGYAGVPADVTKAAIAFESSAGRITVCENGAGVDFSEERAARILKENRIRIDVRLADGDATATAYGCDLTYDYVRINGDYRT